MTSSASIGDTGCTVRQRFFYNISGLLVSSEVELPSAIPMLEDETSADIVIAEGALAACASITGGSGVFRLSRAMEFECADDALDLLERSWNRSPEQVGA